MTESRASASPVEIHAYLVEQLNRVLRRPGMFGGETALWMVVDHLLFVEGQPKAWYEERSVSPSVGAGTRSEFEGCFAS